MACTMPAMAQHPFNLTEVNGTPHYYLIQSIDRPTFYAIPHSNAENSKVSTTSIPNATMRWYFMDAESDSDHQYYYIVSSTGRCLYRYDDNNDGIKIKKTYAELSSLSSDELNKYKFYLEQTGSDYFIHPKGASDLYLNKKGTNPNYSNGYYIKTSTATDAASKWNFVAVGDVTWPQPFTISTNDEKHYYKFQNVTNTSFCLSTSEEWATVSSTGSNKNVWYFLDAGTDATYSSCHYYYIVNALTEKYLYYTGGTGNDVSKVLDYNSEEGDKYRFLIVDAAYKVNNNYTTGYTIVPKLRQAYFSDKDSFAPIAMSNDSRLLLKNDRNSDNYDSHWKIEETEYVGVTVKAPIITNNFDGTISLSTATPGATIYYTTDGTEPTSQSNVYTVPFDIASTTVIKAIAYLGSDYSTMSIYNVPKYTTPTISFDNNTSDITITITCTGATGIYYTTDGSIPTTSSTPYSAPFTVSSGVTVKAIATHAGYLNSDVATWPNDDYSQDYLTFNVRTGGTIVWKAFNETIKTIEYSINGGEWIYITSSSSGESFTVYENDVIRFRGTNSTYASSNTKYSGFDGGTATYDISGNIMSLIYSDGFVGQTTMTDSYNFCSIFKQSKAVSAENLILPAATLTDYCYRAMFSKAHELVAAPALPATTLATGCYWYMFEECPITTAPELNANTLVKECYGFMFEDCSNLNYIKCLATDRSATNCLQGWVTNVASSGTFVKKEGETWPTGINGTPTGWYVVDEGTPAIPTISCDGFEIELSCDTIGADIYYKLNHSETYALYTIPITITSNTFIECYSEKNGKASPIISQTCEYDDRTIYDYSNQSLDTWTYGGNTITTPYSVNAIDGHSSNYARGTFNFETDVNLRSPQPTYLWFQHADQSASIYVDDILVEKHWGGYNAFFVDITDHVHKGTNHIKVALKNNEGNVLAPYAGDFNFNATLGKVMLFTSPYMPSMNYGYDGFHITSTVSSASATINVKTTIPTGATVVCTISGTNCNYTATSPSTGEEMEFTTTITNPRLWDGTLDPYLYNVKLEIYHDNVLYHSYERPYGLRFFEYVFDETVNGNSYTGFLLNGQPYLLRGVCVHDDLANKANALNDDDYTQEFNIITELGCNFLRLAHYPHPKEVYDKCDQLGIIVQTEAPWVNRSSMTETDDYWAHLEGQCADMVNQHYNHPCILFWGVGNEINTTYTNTTEGKDFVKDKIEGYRDTIRSLMPNAWVGYTVSHGTQNGLGIFNNPSVDWIGQNIYVGWYIDKTTNNPTSRLTTAINNATTRNTPCAYSEYGCGGTPTCHSDDFMNTTTTGNNPRHDIEYQMWLHEGHIAAIKNKPELIFTSQWQLFDIAVYNRREGYKVSLDGETVFDNDELKYLNNKGLVERDHVTKKDPFYLYKAWWNQTDKFVHICGKDYEKLVNRVIKCYTNDGNSLSLYVNNTFIESVSVTNNIATFTARSFSGGDEIRVEGATKNDTFTFTDDRTAVFTQNGNWNIVSKWSNNVVPTVGSNVVIAANATIPANCIAHVGAISINSGKTLTIKDGGQLLHSNEGVTATVEKNIQAWTITQNDGEDLTDGWYFIASPISAPLAPSNVANMLTNQIEPPYSYDLYRFNQTANEEWENYHQHSGDFNLVNGAGYLYANSSQVTLQFTGELKPYSASANTVTLAQTGWNLIGNPFTCNVYADQAFYKMNDTHTGLTAELPVSTVIAPCEGIFVNAAATETVTFTKDAPAQSQGSNASLQIALSQAVEPDPATLRQAQGSTPLLDNAIVSFNEGSVLPKFRFGNNAEIYLPQGNEDYAIAFNDKQGEMPLNFKAKENGSYTLTINPETVEMTYLHLIDNLTGTDVDLIATPSYTFTANTTDYESRFRLVFAANDGPSTGSGTFAYISNGNIIVNGEGTLQVIDMTGRVIRSSDAINRVSTSGMTPGVYVLRLINANDVKTQKIVVR